MRGVSRERDCAGVARNVSCVRFHGDVITPVPSSCLMSDSIDFRSLTYYAYYNNQSITRAPRSAGRDTAMRPARRGREATGLAVYGSLTASHLNACLILER